MWSPSPYQIDAPPATGLRQFLEVVVRQVHHIQHTELIKGVWEGPETIVGDIQFLQLLTCPADVIWEPLQKKMMCSLICCSATEPVSIYAYDLPEFHIAGSSLVPRPPSTGSGNETT